jgi:hypothetical protein
MGDKDRFHGVASLFTLLSRKHKTDGK